MPHVYGFIVAALIALSHHAQSEDKNFRVVDASTGEAVHGASGGVWMADNDARWATLWGKVFGAREEGRTPPNVAMNQSKRPAVDFRNTVVIGMVGNRSPNCDGYEVVGYDATGDSAIVRVRAIQTTNTNVKALGIPYLLMVVTRTTKPIEIQMPDVGPDQQPMWKTLTTFPATLEPKKRKP